MTQQQLFDDSTDGTCPECGGGITVTDSIVNVAKCENCGLTLIKNRGRWHEFKNFFGGGKAWKKSSKPKSKAKRRKAA